jgi:vacuolar-type H+-ATPase catalytic subunit A/Vma1
MQSMHKKETNMKKLFVILLLVGLFGCATGGDHWYDNWFTNENDSARIITKGAVAEFLSRNESMVDIVYEVSSEAITYLDAGTITVEQLKPFILDKLYPHMAKLSPMGQIGMQELVTLIEKKLIEQLPKDITKRTVVAKTFMQWINEVAILYKRGTNG